MYLTHKYGDSVDGLKQDVKDMGTSVSTAQNNYIKEQTDKEVLLLSAV